ncbi:DUF1272 domain-containing protein [Kangiella sp. TOML190]|uniref:DUF1272 domain-containing protein n=1 Tax=Kangiella sp. TOML190 TaxID=2931351 RepID=UPI0020424953|nr:DUF1272 domain-containing protein [Kangiella sp. TOML190]
MLKLKPSCEHCDKILAADSTEAMICSFECTFCRDCVDNILANVCPNCGGGFCSRPIRPSQEHIAGVSLQQYPASREKVYKPVELDKHQSLLLKLKTIEPKDR